MKQTVTWLKSQLRIVKSLLVFPGIVRPSDKGCLKKNYFPFGNYHFKRFPLHIVLVGEVIPAPLSMASKTLFVVGYWHGGAMFLQTILYAGGQGPDLSLGYSGTNINKLGKQR